MKFISCHTDNVKIIYYILIISRLQKLLMKHEFYLIYSYFENEIFA